jgi:hypothetical protein
LSFDATSIKTQIQISHLFHFRHRFGSKPGSGIIGTGKNLVIEVHSLVGALKLKICTGGFTEQILVRSESLFGHQGAETKNITYITH